MDHKTSFGSRLRIKLQLVHNARNGSDSDTILLSKQNTRAWFKDHLIVTYSIIRSSVPLMQAAYEQCSNLQEQTKLIDDLGIYYKKHIQEEMNHDEWLLNDLESIGVSRRESLSRKPLQAVAELVGSQYYWIYHWHPICLLGYIALLEGDPPKKEFVEQLQKTTGYPDTAFRTIVKHSDLDPHHCDDLNKLLETLPLETKHEQWITYNALYSANKLIEIRSQVAR